MHLDRDTKFRDPTKTLSLILMRMQFHSFLSLYVDQISSVLDQWKES